MKFPLKTRAIFLTVLTVVLSVLGAGVAIGLLHTKTSVLNTGRFFGIPAESFALFIVLTSLAAIFVVALIWLDYRLHLRDDRIQSDLNGQLARRTEQLLNANEQLQEMDRVKTELIHRVSHELRTPLTSIGGYTEILLGRKAGSLNDLQEDFIRTIEENTVRLQILVDDFMETSRWEVGSQRVQWDDVSLEKVARQAETAWQPILEARGILWNCQIENPLPGVMGDPAKLRSLLNHLISNAAKYTPSNGQVTLKIETKPGKITIIVEDTGIGIPKEFFPCLFQKFERAANVESSEYAGTGLGLYLARQIVEAHRGVIHIESELGTSTRVVVSLPAQNLDRSSEWSLPVRMTSSGERRNE